MGHKRADWNGLAASPSHGGAATAPKLPSDAPYVLPLLSRARLDDILRRLPYSSIQRSLRHNVVPVDWPPNCVHYATCGPGGVNYARRHGLNLVARANPSEFGWALRRVWGGKILNQATFGLFAGYPQFSARRRVTLHQMIVFLLLAICPGLGLAFLPASAAWTAASVLIGLFFLSVVALRLFCLFPLRPSRNRSVKNLSDAELPIYSVLVPIFNEALILKQLLRALTQLNYPALCIKRRKNFSP